MNTYKNLEVTPGLPQVFKFSLLEDDGTKTVLDNFTFKLEIFDGDEKLILTKTGPVAVSLGEVSFLIPKEETSTLKLPLYSYRLIILAPSGFGQLRYQGFLSCKTPVFKLEASVADSAITLPDGTLYVTTATNIIPDRWYALNSTFRFLVSGIGAIVVDGKDLQATVWPNLSVHTSQTLSEIRWVPNLSGMTAFRIKQVSGNITVKYLP